MVPISQLRVHSDPRQETRGSQRQMLARALQTAGVRIPPVRARGLLLFAHLLVIFHHPHRETGVAPEARAVPSGVTHVSERLWLP